MWITLLVMAVAISLEPFRVSMTVLLINQPRPLLHLLAFLVGGFTMGTAVGLIVLFALRPALGSAHFTLPRVQIVIGALALVAAAVVASGVLGRKRDDDTDRGAGPLATRIRRLLNGRSVWAAGIAGLGIALPSVDYLAVLAVIAASGTVAATQVGALMLFQVVAFALVEIPLISYVVDPDSTRKALAALHDWLKSRRRREVAVLLAVVGCVLLGAGLAGL